MDAACCAILCYAVLCRRAREEALKELKHHKLVTERAARDADARMRRVGDKLNKHVRRWGPQGHLGGESG